MPSFETLREEIREVFQIFDEDASGSISLSELTRALYTITGDRVSRSELIKRVTAARETIAQRLHEDQLMQRWNSATSSSHSATPQRTMSESVLQGNVERTSVQIKAPTAEYNGSETESALQLPLLPANVINSHDVSDGIDIEVFEEVVLRKLHARSYDEELTFAFGLLEDKYYPGFITKESLQRAAIETAEPLTEAEINEMFDPLVTGVPSAAVDFTTFTSIQAQARKLDCVETQYEKLINILS